MLKDIRYRTDEASEQGEKRFRELYDKKHLHLLWALTMSQMKMKDQSSLLGFLWSFLHPVLMLTVIFVLFRFKFGGTTEHYAIYVLIGIVPYTHFSNCTSAGMTVLRNMGQLTGQALFPKELLVLSVVLSRTVEFVIALCIATIIAYISGVAFSWSVLALPIVLGLQIIFALWVSLILSWVYLLARDIQHVYQICLRLLFFLSPIFYTRDLLKENTIGQFVLMINPLTHLIDYTRTLILDGKLFSVDAVCIFLLINLLMVYVGYHLFKRFEPHFTELL